MPLHYWILAREKWHSPTNINFIWHILFISKRKISGSRTYSCRWIIFIPISLILKRLLSFTLIQLKYYSPFLLQHYLQYYKYNPNPLVPIKKYTFNREYIFFTLGCSLNSPRNQTPQNPAGIPRQSVPNFFTRTMEGEELRMASNGKRQ